ncbi:hypothetical protein C0Q70_05373 [Pomacea canaliculata]|uniref:Uncharacterized protein n=1 Tax=Pomacea canaliculata TaxID=400727 RepID=A0A2T7PL25_POMCA|nr:hypothetical protein C0Q70_05373 [Pomacea canaliculata]
MTSTEEYKREKRPSWKRSQRCRKRMSTLLHTHVALIVVCTLAALDAACVMGQVICDLLIVNDSPESNCDGEENASSQAGGFVLVIQEKDHVQLKIIKQRLRLSAKRSKETTLKATSYKTEVKQLQGLCRKYGATENEINACGLTGM